VGDTRAPTDPRAVAEAFAERLNAGDLDGMVELFGDESIIVAQPGMVQEREGVRDALAQFVSLGVPFSLDIRHVFTVGDTALVIGDWTMKGTKRIRVAEQGTGALRELMRNQLDELIRLRDDQKPR
jgi:ketosteroid isomerase-like protein